MSELPPPASFVAPDDGLTPDPSFWGRDRAAPRRRGRPPGIVERVAAAIPGRDTRTVVAAVVAVLLVNVVLVSSRASSPPPTPAAATAVRAPATPPRRAATPPRVVVHVAGAVTRPGVVTLPSGARVIDAIDTAGGALASANLDAVNLAARLRDGEQILVPSTASPAPSVTSPNPSPPPTG